VRIVSELSAIVKHDVCFTHQAKSHGYCSKRTETGKVNRSIVNRQDKIADVKLIAFKCRESGHNVDYFHIHALHKSHIQKFERVVLQTKKYAKTQGAPSRRRYFQAAGQYQQCGPLASATRAHSEARAEQEADRRDRVPELELVRSAAPENSTAHKISIRIAGPKLRVQQQA
jgi:hypothetical protein